MTKTFYEDVILVTIETSLTGRKQRHFFDVLRRQRRRRRQIVGSGWVGLLSGDRRQRRRYENQNWVEPTTTSKTTTMTPAAVTATTTSTTTTAWTKKFKLRFGCQLLDVIGGKKLDMMKLLRTKYNWNYSYNHQDLVSWPGTVNKVKVCFWT